MIRILGLTVIDDEHVRQAMKAAGAEPVLLTAGRFGYP
jgi:hypothetical protein